MSNKQYPRMLVVRLTEHQRERLQEIADYEEVWVSDIVRDLIEARLDQAE